MLLSRAGSNLERLALSLGTIDFSASDVDQIKQYSAIIAATKDLHGTLSDKEKKKRKRAERDPDAPKKPMSSYMFFQEVKREEFVKKHPELAYKDVLKLLGTTWKQMSDAQKAVCLSFPLVVAAGFGVTGATQPHVPSLSSRTSSSSTTPRNSTS